jgi:penicillin V acylase-like amidase (Ntn superfamily)
VHCWPSRWCPPQSETAWPVTYYLISHQALGSFQNVEQVKQALKNKEVDLWLPKIASMGDLVTPLHFAMYDKKGGSIVIEFDYGIHVYDNPSYVMTNDPSIP